METIIGIDKVLFHFFNTDFTFGFLDWFMPIITNERIWMPFILLAWLGMIFSGKKNLRVLAVLLLVGVGANDLICARILKKNIGRLRPCSIAQINGFKCRLLLPKKGSKSFPSNHASNTAAFAGIVLLYAGFKVGLPFLILSFIVGYSRVYVGVHFPFDVIAGWTIGLLMAKLTLMHAQRLFPTYFNCLEPKLEEACSTEK